MIKFLFVALSFLICIPFTFADFRLNPENRLANVDPGYCAWVSLACIGKQLQLRSLYNVVEERMGDDDEMFGLLPKNYGYLPAFRRKLIVKDIPFRTQDIGDLDTEILKTADQNNYPAIVAGWSKNPEIFYGGCHAIVLLDYDELKNHVSLYDCNHPDKTFSWDCKSFKSWWLGWTVVIKKHEN